MSAGPVDLKPDRNLIDPNFDGYKLSLDPLPIYRVALDGGIDEVRLRDDQYSYQHVKAFGVHNHLIPDPWYRNLMYYIDTSWNVRKYTASQQLPMQPPTVAFKIPDYAEMHQRADRLNVTLYPVSPQYVCLSDGAGHVYLIKTGDREQNVEWKECYRGSPVTAPDSDIPLSTVLTHAVQHNGDDVPYIECLLVHVDKNTEADNENKAPLFLTNLTWITLACRTEDKWELLRTRCLVASAAPDYCMIENNGKGLIVASEKPFKFTYDSLHPVETNESVEKEDDNTHDEKTYVWTQTSEDLTLFFSLPSDVTKPDIEYTISGDRLELGIKNGEGLLKGSFFASVDREACTWMLSQENDENKLQLHIEKGEPGIWPEVIVGDKRGNLVADLEQMEEIHQRLAHLTSDQWNPPPDKAEKAYNSQQLEECDAFPDAFSCLTRFDGESHKPTHQANLSSHQWLFNVPAEGATPPCLCLRHDVDGLVWQPVDNGEDTPWKHVATFNAFGYVQASKQQKKYCSCSPDFSFAVICDCVRHIYVYRQPSVISTPLRNRKTGREVSALAKQQLISLDSVDNIMGLCVQNNALFALSGSTLFMVRINEEQDGYL